MSRNWQRKSFFFATCTMHIVDSYCVPLPAPISTAWKRIAWMQTAWPLHFWRPSSPKRQKEWQNCTHFQLNERNGHKISKSQRKVCRCSSPRKPYSLTQCLSFKFFLWGMRGDRLCYSIWKLSLLPWFLFSSLAHTHTLQSQFVCRHRRCRRCSNSCHSSPAHRAIVTSAKYIFLEWREMPPFILRMWMLLEQLETMSGCQNGDSSVSEVASLCVLELWVSANRTFISCTQHTAHYTIQTAGDSYVIFYSSRFHSTEAGGAPFAWHVRGGTYVVENFDEIFMLKSKTLSPSTAGIKDLHFVIYFCRLLWVRAGASRVHTIHQLCLGASIERRCERKKCGQPGEADESGRLIEIEFDSMMIIALNPFSFLISPLVLFLHHIISGSGMYRFRRDPKDSIHDNVHFALDLSRTEQVAQLWPYPACNDHILMHIQNRMLVGYDTNSDTTKQQEPTRGRRLEGLNRILFSAHEQQLPKK